MSVTFVIIPVIRYKYSTYSLSTSTNNGIIVYKTYKKQNYLIKNI